MTSQFNHSAVAFFRGLIAVACLTAGVVALLIGMPRGDLYLSVFGLAALVIAELIFASLGRE